MSWVIIFFWEEVRRIPLPLSVVCSFHCESTYDVYESSFLSLLTQLKESLKGCEFLPNSLVKDIFMNGLFCTLQSKVCCKFPNTFHDALKIARKKHRRMMYLAQGSTYVPKVSTSQT